MEYLCWYTKLACIHNKAIVECSSVLIRGLLLSLELEFLFNSEFWTLRVQFLQKSAALDT